ncbi:MAG: metal-dependent hydrolase [Negativicutes bacterium]|nr:metal-dependent hydrolase [Negativicutes bacterium]
MDALTHAVIGVAIGGLSGNPLTLGDPVYIATVLGSQAPDFDLAARLKGQVNYLRHHRSFSHSLPGLLVWSALIAVGFYLHNPSLPSSSMFMWSFFGGLSHIVMDYFNTHGAAVLCPWKKDRKSLNLLNVFDPLLLGLLLCVHTFRLPPGRFAAVSLSLLTIYIVLRLILKKRAAAALHRHFAEEKVLHVVIMPCLTHILYWDFLVKTSETYYVGRIGALLPAITVHAKLPRQTLSPLAIRARKTAIGRFFAAFTPFCYFAAEEDKENPVVRIYDLRYYFKTRFLHSGTVVFNADCTPAQAYIQSYGDKIDMRC